MGHFYRSLRALTSGRPRSLQLSYRRIRYYLSIERPIAVHVSNCSGRFYTHCRSFDSAHILCVYSGAACKHTTAEHPPTRLALENKKKSLSISSHRFIALRRAECVWRILYFHRVRRCEQNFNGTDGELYARIHVGPSPSFSRRR